MAEEARLESVCTPKGYREFESRSLRKDIPTAGCESSWLFLFVDPRKLAFGGPQKENSRPALSGRQLSESTLTGPPGRARDSASAAQRNLAAGQNPLAPPYQTGARHNLPGLPLQLTQVSLKHGHLQQKPPKMTQPSSFLGQLRQLSLTRLRQG